jgi:hypothetical protein
MARDSRRRARSCRLCGFCRGFGVANLEVEETVKAAVVGGELVAPGNGRDDERARTDGVEAHAETMPAHRTEDVLHAVDDARLAKVRSHRVAISISAAVGGACEGTVGSSSRAQISPFAATTYGGGGVVEMPNHAKRAATSDFD